MGCNDRVSKDTEKKTLLSYQIPYNSVAVDSSPSYTLYASGNDTLILSDVEAALGMGWYVTVPDFEGTHAAFGSGVLEGHATLDAVRAVRNFRSQLKADDTRLALWGYSGGSIASEFAAELQVQYAPELDFAGVAIGGVVSNTTSLLDGISGTRFAGLLPAGLLGITTEYPAAHEYLLSHLKTEGPHNKTGFLEIYNMTINQAFVAYAGQDILSYFANGRDAIEAPVVQQAINQDGYMGYHGTPQMPLFVYKAIGDEVTPIQDTDVLVDRYCGVGANIVYERNTVGGHLAEEANGDVYALEWLRGVLEGEYTHVGCSIRDVTWNTTNSPF